MPHDSDGERLAKRRRKRREISRRHYLKQRLDPEFKASKAAYHKKRRANDRLLAKRELITGRTRPEVCDVCGLPPNDERDLHFDHDHQRGHFRGWLCRRCNIVLGQVADDVDLLRKLIAYLERTKVNTSPQLTLPGV